MVTDPRLTTEQIAELLRRDWAVRTLDEYSERSRIRTATVSPRRDDAGYWLYVAGKFVRGVTRDEVRLSAARVVWPRLHESVRAEIGEEPT